MRIPRIFVDDFLQQGEAVVFMGSAANHVSRVLRMKIGDNVCVFNGSGGSWLAEIINVARQKVTINLLAYDKDSRESPLNIHLGQCLSRGERMDYAIQKATEMGVTSITPIFSEYCGVRINKERQEKRLHHWRQLAISSCEQCGRNILPVIHSPIDVTAWCSHNNADLKVVLHHRAKKTLSSLDKPKSVMLLIGPEGGLSSTEIAQVEAKGFSPVVLGPRILRTETAPVASIALLQYLWGDGVR